VCPIRDDGFNGNRRTGDLTRNARRRDHCNILPEVLERARQFACEVAHAALHRRVFAGDQSDSQLALHPFGVEAT